MTSTIDDSGFYRQRFPEQRADLAQKWLSNFPTTRTDPESKNGRIISIQAELNDSADAKIQFVLDQFNPYSAVGNQLTNLAPLMNKRRRNAVRSSVTLTVTADSNGTTIPSGSIVRQTIGAAQFRTISTVVVPPNGSRNVPAVAVNFGPIAAAAGSLNQIVTPEFGWVAVTNAQAASVGRDRDVDSVLRANMLYTSSAPAGTPAGIQTAILQVPGVTYVRVYENRTDAVNSIGMPEHSVFAVVDGGADDDVGLALMNTVASGITITGPDDIPSASWVSPYVQNPANLDYEYMYFSRPLARNVSGIAINVTKGPDYPPDGDALIKNAVADMVNSWDIGRVLYASRLYSAINSVVDVDINTVTIEGTDRVTPSAFERLVVDLANITIA